MECSITQVFTLCTLLVLNNYLCTGEKVGCKRGQSSYSSPGPYTEFFYWTRPTWCLMKCNNVMKIVITFLQPSSSSMHYLLMCYLRAMTTLPRVPPKYVLLFSPCMPGYAQNLPAGTQHWKTMVVESCFTLLHLTLITAYVNVTCISSQMNIIEAGGGRCICELKVDEEHQNRGGMLHGGMTATLVDVVSTAALMSNDNTGPGVSVDMNVSLVFTLLQIMKCNCTSSFQGNLRNKLF